VTLDDNVNYPDMYVLKKKYAEKQIEEICPNYESKELLTPIENLGYISASGSSVINFLLIMFSSINFGVISASNLFFLSKFLNISFPLNILSFHQSSKGFIDEVMDSIKFKRIKEEPKIPLSSNFRKYNYSLFIWNNIIPNGIVWLFLIFMIVIMYIFWKWKASKNRVMAEEIAQKESNDTEQKSKKSTPLVLLISSFFHNSIMSNLILICPAVFVN